MTITFFIPAITAEPILPHTSRAVIKYLNIFASGFGNFVQAQDPKLEGCFILPNANLVLAGTAYDRPLLYHEGDALMRYIQADVILLRFNAQTMDVSFDIRLRGQYGWLCRYVAFAHYGATCLRPAIGNGPLLRITPSGIQAEFQSSRWAQKAELSRTESPLPTAWQAGER